MRELLNITPCQSEAVSLRSTKNRGGKGSCWWLLMLGIILSGCSGLREDPRLPKETAVSSVCGASEHYDAGAPRRPRDHILRISPQGVMVDVSDTERVLSGAEAAQAIKHMLCQAELLAASKGAKRPRVLIYAHGGLNSYDNTDQRVASGQAARIMDDEKEWYYPIYLSWNSAPFSSYGEHLLRVREGRRANLAAGAVTAPFIFVSDILSSVGRYPATLSYQLINDKNRIATRYYPAGISGAWDTALTKMCGQDNACRKSSPQYIGNESSLRANLSTYMVSDARAFARAAVDIPTGALRYTIMTLWHSAVASSSWDVMKRRTQTPYFPDYYFDERWRVGEPAPATYLFTALLERAGALPQSDYELVLVGHSMGTMIMNQALVKYGREWARDEMLKDIVYMAAAADIESSLAALRPVLAPSVTDRDKPVNFYNLTLNRVAEVSERHGGGIVPTGSLLVSIDQHHETPEHPMRRTFGSEVNVLSSIDLIDHALAGAEGELVFKAFDFRADALPRKHGHFGELAFWRRETWRLPGLPESADVQVTAADR